jgi:hypothetical protein
MIEGTKSIWLAAIRMNSIPNFKILGGSDPWIVVHYKGKRLILSQKMVSFCRILETNTVA